MYSPPTSATADAIAQLASALVAIPSRGGIDSPAPVIQFAADWLSAAGVPARLLHGPSGEAVGLLAEISGAVDGPAFCLNACLDTAPFGDEALWTRPPTTGALAEGKLWGRGSADSKIAVAILMNIAAQLARAKPSRGTLYVLLDADEHTGNFGGVKAFTRAIDRPLSAVVLGYPGHSSLVVGARGFWRVRVEAQGESAHSGATSKRGRNAVSAIAKLIAAIDGTPLPVMADPAFAHHGQATVTSVSGGEGFTQVPDTAQCHIDVRLTLRLTQSVAQGWLQDILDRVREEIPEVGFTVETISSWPAYVTAADHPVTEAFRHAGEAVFGSPIETEVCGPSNIGNFLSTQGIATICALGVRYGNLHGVDEYCVLKDIAPVTQCYLDALATLLGRGIDRST